MDHLEDFLTLSPILQELLSKRELLARQMLILDVLRSRFRDVPDVIEATVKSVTEQERLVALMIRACNCASIDRLLTNDVD
jgi:hypothetical protein